MTSPDVPGPADPRDRARAHPDGSAAPGPASRAEEMAAFAARRQQRETAAAQALVDAFVRDAVAQGLAPVPLRVTSYDGRGSYRTPLQGWYLRRSVAVGTDGRFYVLLAPASLAARFRGVEPEPSDPPLVLGAGGRDGESVDLAVALRAVLDRG